MKRYIVDFIDFAGNERSTFICASAKADCDALIAEACAELARLYDDTVKLQQIRSMW